MNLVILDAGHAEKVAGKEAPDKSLREWQFNNEMQYAIKKRLEDHSIEVYLTNPSPVGKDEIGLTQRATLANNYWSSKGKPKALFISLHANAYGSVFNTARGTETYVASNASNNSKNAAQLINNSVYDTFKCIDKDAKNRGIKTQDFTVIYKANMPAILVEYGFYTNIDDLHVLKNNKNELVEATVKGICKYFGITYKETVQTQAYTVKINCDVLNVRSGPGTDYKVATQVKRNEVYTIVETKNNWGKLKSGAGYINLSYTIK